MKPTQECNYTAPEGRTFVRCDDCGAPLVDALHRDYFGEPLCEGCYVARLYPAPPRDASGRVSHCLTRADCIGALSVPERRARCGHAI